MDSVFARLDRRLASRWLSLAVLACVIAVASALPLSAESSFKIEVAGVPPAGLPKSLSPYLEHTGTRLLYTANGEDMELCQLWWVKTPATLAQSQRSPYVVYPELRPGQLLGALYVPQKLEDSYHQELLPGWYTLRYGQLDPKKDSDDDEDQDAGDTPPDLYRDFALLSSVKSDQSPARLQADRLLRLATETSGTRLPAAIKLLPLHPAYRKFPAVVSDDRGYCAVQFRLHARSSAGQSELPLSILLFTPPNVSAED